MKHNTITSCSENPEHPFILTTINIKMKKYYQLVLVIVSVVSFITLLFYRHEYNRLRYVMEVLSFFGKPGQVAECLPPNISQNLKKSFSFTDPLPSWQRLTDTHFVYSAFWEKNDIHSHVKVFSVEAGKTIPQYSCEVWFEDSNIPITGRFSYTIIQSKESALTHEQTVIADNVIAYNLYCKPKQIPGIPFGVTFFKTETLVPSHVFIPVGYPVDRPILENSTAVCIVPGFKPVLQKSAVIEFLSYHHLIGVSEFIVYDKGLPNRIAQVLQDPIIKENFGIELSLLPWNFPFPHLEAEPVMRLVVERDCIQRTAGKVRNVAVLGWGEYVVPRYHHTLAGMLDDFDTKKKTTTSFEVPTIVFCTDLLEHDSDDSVPLVLRKTRYYKGDDMDPPLHLYRPQTAVSRFTVPSTQRVSQGIAAIHRYTECMLGTGEQPVETLPYERAILRFAGDLKRSKLLRAWSSGRLF